MEVVLKRIVSAAFCSILLIAASCSGSSDPLPSPICTAVFLYGLDVYVNDSLTNAHIASGASLVARDGTFKDSVAFPAARPEVDAFPLKSAGERAGTYTITVTKPGYQAWTRTSVKVTSDECHVIPVNVTALLKPTS